MVNNFNIKNISLYLYKKYMVAAICKEHNIIDGDGNQTFRVWFKTYGGHLYTSIEIDSPLLVLIPFINDMKHTEYYSIVKDKIINVAYMCELGEFIYKIPFGNDYYISNTGYFGELETVYIIDNLKYIDNL